jgi:hypothetical protein
VAQENEHLKILAAARGKLIGHRRHVAGEIAEDSRRGFNDDQCNSLVLIQSAIEAVDKAIADETQSAREQNKGVFIRASDPKA